jgi:hypothetical protein
MAVLEGGHHAQPGLHRPAGVVLMRLGIAKVDQQPIAQILCDIPLQALDHFVTGLLIGPHDRPVIFGIELAGQGGGIDEVAEQHGELAALRLCRTRCATWRGPLWRGVCLADGRRGMLECWRSWRLGCSRVADPAQATPRVIDHLRVGVEEFILEDRQLVLVQLELEPQRAVGDAAPALEQRQRLIQNLLKGHGCPSRALGRTPTSPSRDGRALLDTVHTADAPKMEAKFHTVPVALVAETERKRSCRRCLHPAACKQAVGAFSWVSGAAFMNSRSASITTQRPSIQEAMTIRSCMRTRLLFMLLGVWLIPHPLDAAAPGMAPGIPVASGDRQR